MFKRSCVLEAGGYRPGFAATEDYDLLVRLLDHYEAVCQNEVLYKWRFQPNSRSGQMLLRQAQEMRLVAQMTIDRRLNQNDPLRGLSADAAEAKVRELSAQTPEGTKRRTAAEAYWNWGEELYRSGYRLQSFWAIFKSICYGSSLMTVQYRFRRLITQPHQLH